MRFEKQVLQQKIFKKPLRFLCLRYSIARLMSPPTGGKFLMHFYYLYESKIIFKYLFRENYSIFTPGHYSGQNQK
jgi:hypothetical protein